MCIRVCVGGGGGGYGRTHSFISGKMLLFVKCLLDRCQVPAGRSVPAHASQKNTLDINISLTPRPAAFFSCMKESHRAW